MGLFNKQKSAAEVPQSQMLQSRYANACNNVLLVVALTAINIILLATNSNTYFLFSAYIPFALVDVAMVLCGRYPAEFYTGDFAGMEFFPQSVFVIALCIAAVILLIYVLCWVFAKKQKCGWLIAALVLFLVDTVAMFALNGVILDSVFDYVIHVWVIISLVSGIAAFGKLKKLPAEPEADAVPMTEAEAPVPEITEETL